jgi:hypothetical protein
MSLTDNLRLEKTGDNKMMISVIPIVLIVGAYYLSDDS